MKVLLLMILNLATIFSFGCDCKRISKEADQTNSDFIFTGVIVNVYEDSFKIKLVENLKGYLKDTVTAKIDDCSILPQKGESWLFYAKLIGDGNVYISHCSWSRSFNWPFNLNSNIKPIPPSQNNNYELNSYLNDFYKGMALSELRDDIINLRELKMYADLIEIKNLSQEIEDKVIQLKCLSIILCVLLFIVIVIKVKKNF